MNIAIIPARGGSKRIPRKNIKLFCGRPIISYAIEAALTSGLFQHVIVSTEDDEISRVAKKNGAEVPFMRPMNLSDDHTATAPVIAQAIIQCQEVGLMPDNVCCIYPCAPFIRADDLRVALNMLRTTNAEYSFPVAEFPSSVYRGLKLASDGGLTSFFPENELVRTQDLDAIYYDAGQFYWGARDAWFNNQKVHNSAVGLVIPNWRAIDIDTEDDWYRAELLWESLLRGRPETVGD